MSSRQHQQALWEILVPATDRNGKKITIARHRVWDKKIRSIAGGLTILKPAHGHWISPERKLFVEPMIPVRIFCVGKDIKRIADFTAEHYRQDTVMYYAISREVFIRKRRPCKGNKRMS